MTRPFMPERMGYGFRVMCGTEEMDHAETLKDAKRKRNVCIFGGIEPVYILRDRDGKRWF